MKRITIALAAAFSLLSLGAFAGDAPAKDAAAAPADAKPAKATKKTKKAAKDTKAEAPKGEEKPAETK